jgi:hypothetical protein
MGPGDSPVTISQLRKLLCRGNKSFTMPLWTLKDRLGHPSSIKILHKWCTKTGRDVVLMTYEVDDGSIDLYCPIEVIKAEETIVDGWFGLTVKRTPGHNEPSSGRPRVGLAQQQRLFPPATPVDSPGPDPQSDWRTGAQRSLADEYGGGRPGPKG